MSQAIVISKRDFDDVITSLEWALEKGDFECNCEPHYEFDTNATIHRDNCATSMADHIEITLDNLKAAASSSGRPATQIEVEAMSAIVRLQDENRAMAERLSQITREVEAFRQLAVNRGLMIGEIRAWNNIKKLTIYYKPEEPKDG